MADGATVITAPTGGIANVTYKMYITVRDQYLRVIVRYGRLNDRIRYLNPILQNTASLVYVNSSGLLPLNISVYDPATGTLEISYSARQAGQYGINVSSVATGFCFGGCPYTFQLTPGIYFLYYFL